MGGMEFLPYNKRATEQFMEKKTKEEAKAEAKKKKWERVASRQAWTFI